MQTISLNNNVAVYSSALSHANFLSSCLKEKDDCRVNEGGKGNKQVVILITQRHM